MSPNFPRGLRDACRAGLDLGDGAFGLSQPAAYYSLPRLEAQGVGPLSRLPISIRVVLESLLRNCDGRKVEERNVRELAAWKPDAPRTAEIPFVVGRVVLNCAAGIPLLGDLTAMRDAVKLRGGDPESVQPQVPVDMTLDHTLAVDYSGSPDALLRNMQLEVERNNERFAFVKWAVQAFNGVRLIPPGFGILHQINLEYFAPGLIVRDGIAYADSLVGTDSHTCMIAGLGTVGWGVGGIEAAAATLGQPVYMLTPDVVGVNITGTLKPGVTATDLVLHVTQMMRRAKVVGKFVEFFGSGTAHLTVPDRATISNMAVEYGATIGFFPVDEQTCRFLRQTGRPEADVGAVEAYYRAQGLFGTHEPGEIDYSQVLTLDLSQIVPAVAGPKRPQDRIPLPELKSSFSAALLAPIAEGGYGRPAAGNGDVAVLERDAATALRDGRIVIAAITSCTNTSNPSVMLAAGLVAKKAVARGLAVRPWVKPSLAPGSRVVSKYLEAADLQGDLDKLGFNVVGYSCTTCVGSSGPLNDGLEEQIIAGDLVACAVLSGNRNFEARIHPQVRAAFLASPPLVVAFALAGRIDIDLENEPLGIARNGSPVYLKDVWPSAEELNAAMAIGADPRFYREVYSMDFDTTNPYWGEVPGASGQLFPWDAKSLYIKPPPFLTDPKLRGSSLRDYAGGRAIAILGDSITTDHISPIGNIKTGGPAGNYLTEHGIRVPDFNNYGSRRMNHEVMVRGAFANVRLRNQMAPGVEGGITKHYPDGGEMPIFDAAMAYADEGVPLFVFAGEEYGTGSARDWAAKGTRLLGVRAVIARSFERIHRSNLVGLGVLPCQLPEGVSATTLKLTGEETFDLVGLAEPVKTRQPVTLRIHRKDGSTEEVKLTLRLDTPAEVDYVRQGGILPFILSELKH
ncbi:MAG: aconitate hydratase 1 [Betaproteobacteria bacterium]|nr:aconitate hydratase 1 [Betaproteobacteria bacterium]